MPEKIDTAQIVSLDTERLEIDDTYPGTYGFYVRLDRDPGPEWAQEFNAVYDGALYPGKPPVVFHGNALCVFYLPRYTDDLSRYLRFLKRIVADTNGAVERRNAVLPDEEEKKSTFRQFLRKLSQDFP